MQDLRVVSETAPLFRRPHEDRTRPMVRNAKTQRQRSGKAPGKPRGRHAQKRSATEAPQGEPGCKKHRLPVFGAAFMIFRVLCCASVVGAIYAPPNIPGLLPDLLCHDMAAVGVAAAAAGTGLKLAWRRCAQDGPGAEYDRRGRDSPPSTLSLAGASHIARQ